MLRPMIAAVLLALVPGSALGAPCAHSGSTGSGTYYEQGGGVGACLLPFADPLGHAVAVGPAFWGGSEFCGACLEITGDAGTVTARVVDQYPEGTGGWLDMSQATFEAVVGPAVLGIGPITWTTVPCPGVVDISFVVSAGSSEWFLLLQPRYHRYRVTGVEVRSAGDTVWHTMTRDTANRFQLAAPGTPFVFPLSVRLTDVHGAQVVAVDVVDLIEGAEQDGGGQFPLCDEDVSVSVPVLDAAVPLQAWPNPVRSRAYLAWRNTTPVAAATLTIHDLRGREVRRLLDARGLPAGVTQVSWDRLDERGVTVAAGVYYARLEADGESRRTALLVLR